MFKFSLRGYFVDYFTQNSNYRNTETKQDSSDDTAPSPSVDKVISNAFAGQRSNIKRYFAQADMISHYLTISSMSIIGTMTATIYGDDIYIDSHKCAKIHGATNSY